MLLTPPFSNCSLQNCKWNPAGHRQPVACSSLFLGALKIIITPPLPWFRQEENNLKDASGKSMRVSSPVEEYHPGYLDPPGQLFKQPRSAPPTSKHHSVLSLPCYPSSINWSTSIQTPSSGIRWIPSGVNQHTRKASQDHTKHDVNLGWVDFWNVRQLTCRFWSLKEIESYIVSH